MLLMILGYGVKRLKIGPLDDKVGLGGGNEGTDGEMTINTWNLEIFSLGFEADQLADQPLTALDDV